MFGRRPTVRRVPKVVIAIAMPLAGSACIAQVEVTAGDAVAFEGTTTSATPTTAPRVVPTTPAVAPTTPPVTTPPVPPLPSPTDLQTMAIHTLELRSAHVRMILTPAGNVAMTLDGEYSDGDTHYVATVPDEPPGEFTYIDPDLYIRETTSSPWMLAPTEDVAPYDIIRMFPVLQRGALVILGSGTLTVTRVGTEAVGSTPCEHLRVDVPSSMSASAGVTMDHIDAWVCDGLILRTVFAWRGEDGDDDTMMVDVTLDLPGQPVTVKRPEGVAPAPLPEVQFTPIEDAI